MSGIKGPAKNEISSFGMCLEDSVFWRCLITKKGAKILGVLTNVIYSKIWRQKVHKGGSRRRARSEVGAVVSAKKKQTVFRHEL